MKRAYFRLYAITFFSALILFFSCGRQQAEWQGTIEHLDGVTVVHNPVDPMVEDILELEEELTIGEADGAEEYMFQRIGSIAVDEIERIYVSDRKESHIKVYDQNGKYLRTIGRKGQGPGEFQRITRIQILTSDNLLVYNSKTRRLSFFSLDGLFITSKFMTDIQALDIMMNSNRGIIADTVQLNPQSA